MCGSWRTEICKVQPLTPHVLYIYLSIVLVSVKSLFLNLCSKKKIKNQELKQLKTKINLTLKPLRHDCSKAI